MLYFFSAIKDAYADSIELQNRNQKYGQINNFVSTIILLYSLYFPLYLFSVITISRTLKRHMLT